MAVATLVFVMRTNHLARAAGMFAMILAAASCAPHDFGADENGSDRGSASDNGPRAATRSEQNAGAPVQGVATFTAADVARIVLVLEQSSIAQARLAEDKAWTMEVKTYAARIIRERTEAMERLAAILERTSPRSQDPTAPLFEGELARSKDWLVSQESGFDLPFMTAEMGANARIIGLLEASLLPSASQATARPGTEDAARELEEELIALRTQTAAQMVHALRVQGVLRAGNAPFQTDTSAGGSRIADAPTQNPH